MLDAVVLFSGGIGSWGAAKRAVEQRGTAEGLVLLFTDVKGEDEDLYRFLPEAAANVGAELVTIADGRTIWEVFRDKRFLGNSRIDPCSQILKRELARDWIGENLDPGRTVYVGFDAMEVDRFERARPRWEPWVLEAPLCDPPYLLKDDLLAWARHEGLRTPRLYDLGFQTNNCGGGCVKAGKAAFANLWRVLPERYAEWEQNEEDFRAFIGKDVSILRDRGGGTVQPVTLREFRGRLEAGAQVDQLDWGSCSCFFGEPDGA